MSKDDSSIKQEMYGCRPEMNICSHDCGDWDSMPKAMLTKCQANLGEHALPANWLQYYVISFHVNAILGQKCIILASATDFTREVTLYFIELVT